MNKFTIARFNGIFPDEDACLAFVKDMIYPDGIVCRKCGDTKHYKLANRKAYSCNTCGTHVYPLAGTIFGKSSTPLKSWFYAMYLMASIRTGISAKQLERELGVTYKTAWRMFSQIRKLLVQDSEPLFGEVEVDETFVGGKRRGVGSGSKEGKTLVIGALERDGDIRMQVIDDRTRRTLHQFIRDHVDDRAERIITDEWAAYKGIGDDKDTKHETVNHAQGEYVRGDVYTNSVENVWSLLKRSIVGSYHHVSEKHLDAYLDELEWRFNNRDNPYLFRDTLLKLLTADNLQYKTLTS